MSVTEPVAGSRRGLSKPLVAGEPILKRSDRREATSDRRRAGGYGAADGAPIAWDAADDLPMHPRTRGSSRAASSSSAFPSCAALVTGVALMMMVAVCALAVVHPELARAGATHAAAAWTGRVSSFVSSFRRETVDTQSARLAFLAPHGHDGRHRHAQKTTAKMGPGCELLSVEEAAASVAAAFAKGESSIGAACEAAKQFRWDDVDPYVDAAAKDRVGGNEDEGKVVVFHAGSRFDPDAVTRAAEMMARDDEVDSKVSPGEGSAGEGEKRKEKSGAAREGKRKEKSGAAREGKKENALPLPGGGAPPPPRPTGNLTAPPAPPAPSPRPVPALRDSSTAKSKKGAGLGEGEGANDGVLGVFRGWMRRRETSEERAFRAWQKKHDTGEVGAATAARRLLAVPGRDGRSKTTKSRSKDRGEGSEGGWTCVIVGENARVAQKISRAVADVGLPCASVVNRANKTRDGANVRGEECEVKRARAADVKLMSRARHVVATEHNDGAHVAALLRRCARDAA